jgi:predicted small lipoprotein YifL
MSRAFILMAIMLLVTMSLSACGKRGTLEPPAAAPAETTSQTAPEPKPGEKPHRPFVLDPLLR